MARCSSRSGSPPMPMLPSASSTWPQVPSPGNGPNTSRRTIGVRRRRHSRCATADRSTPSAGTPRSPSADTRRPGPHPRSIIGPVQRSSSQRSSPSAERRHRGTARATSTPSSRTSRADAPARAGSKAARDRRATGAGERDRRRGPAPRTGCNRRSAPGAPDRDDGSADRAGSPATAAANRVQGATRATAVASEAVSTSVSSGSRPTRSPAVRSARRVRSPVSSRDVGTSATAAAARGSRRPSAHQPPSAAGPRTASTMPRCRGPAASASRAGLDLRGVHPDLQHRAAGQQAGGVAVGGRDAVPQVRAPLDAGS